MNADAEARIRQAVAELADAIVAAVDDGPSPAPDRLYDVGEAATATRHSKIEALLVDLHGGASLGQGRQAASRAGWCSSRVHQGGPGVTAGYAGRAGPDELTEMPLADEPEDASRTDVVDDDARQVVPEPTEAEVSAATRRYVEAVAAEYGIDLTEPPYHRTPKVRLPSYVDEREYPSVNGRVRFVSARELVTDEPPDVEYPFRALGAACGSICEIDGKPKASGKTTPPHARPPGDARRAEFLGQPTIREPAVLLTEQSRPSIRPERSARHSDWTATSCAS